MAPRSQASYRRKDHATSIVPQVAAAVSEQNIQALPALVVGAVLVLQSTGSGAPESFGLPAAR